MKDLTDFYENLKSMMEVEAGKRELLFRFPNEKRKKRKKLPLLAAAAALVFLIPFTVNLSYSRYQAKKLVNEENSYFIESLFMDNLFTFENLPEAIPESDWFDTPDTNYYQ